MGEVRGSPGREPSPNAATTTMDLQFLIAQAFALAPLVFGRVTSMWDRVRISSRCVHGRRAADGACRLEERSPGTDAGRDLYDRASAW
jgi:hypothetical protein